MRIGRLRGSFAGLGAWSAPQVDEAQLRLGALEDRLGVKHDMITTANEGGYPPALIEEAFTAHDMLGDAIDEMNAEFQSAMDLGTSGSWQSFGNHMADLEARIAAFDPIPGAAASSRTGLVVGATIGAVVIAGALAGLIWFATAKRRR